MIRHSLLGIFVIFLVALMSCSNSGTIQPRATDAALKENWINQVNTNPDNWLKNADPWFLTGKPNQIQLNAAKASAVSAMTTSSIQVPDFTHLSVMGDFQVQIVGGQDRNSVYVYGPNALTNQVSVSFFQGALMVKQQGELKGNMQNVIVRIGVRNLHSIVNMGNSLILGRTIMSDKLMISASGNGSIMLAGNMNVTKINQTGSGTITVIGAYSPKLDINVKGPGNVNVSGQVGIENLTHEGVGAVNIIGADTDSLCIKAVGKGITTVFGYVNLKELSADNSQVYVFWVYSNQANITQKGKSVVGLAGSAGSINVDLSNESCYLGQYMRSCTAYIKTKGSSHADVAADLKIFVSAVDKSTIYYFGSPEILSRYTRQQGFVVAIGQYQAPTAPPPPKGTFVPPPLCASLDNSPPRPNPL